MPKSPKRYRKTAILTSQGLQKLEAAKLKAQSSSHSPKTYTLERLSEYTGLSPHTIGKVHTGKAGVDLQTLVRYFKAFNLTLEPDDYCQPLRSVKPELSQPIQPPDRSPSSALSINVSTAESPRLQPIVSWGIAPDVSHFYGRTAELATLQQWVLEERCRLVTLLGMRGIGKTWLATKLTEQIQHRFKVVIWRSLQSISRSHAPLPFSHFLDDLIYHLVPHAIPAISEPIAAKVQQLIDLLRRIPCLLVLDNVESVLQREGFSHISGTHISGTHISDNHALDRRILGHWISESPSADRFTKQDDSDTEAYSQLFKYLGQGRHQSCVILTSQIEVKVFQSISGNPLKVRSLTLQGLRLAEIQQMFRVKGIFQGSVIEWQRLVNYYNRNPLMLCIVAKTIQRLFDGSITEFLQHGTLIFADICDLLEQQLGKISDREQAVMKVFATQGAPLSLADLQLRLSPSIPTPNLLEVLKSLEARSLIERRAAQLFLTPLLRDYVNEWFVSSSNQLVNGRSGSRI